MRTAEPKRLVRYFLNLLASVLLSVTYAIMAPAGASAAPSMAVEITGDGVAKPAVFTRADLQKMENRQYVYSAINTWPTKKWYVGKGVALQYLLDLAGMKKEACLVKVTSNDGYCVTLTIKELFEDKRYCFPHFKESVGKDSDGNQVGSCADAKLVEPILALTSVEGSDNPAYMNDLNSFLLMLGQRAVSEQTGNLFVKYVSKIEVLTTAPERWDKPRANPESGVVPVGSMITLSNAHMDDDKIYYTLDGTTPTLNSPMYNWIAKRWWSARADVLGVFNHPIGPINKDTVIKAITIGPGKLDSEVATFSFKTASDGGGGVISDPDRKVSGDNTVSEGPAGGTSKQNADGVGNANLNDISGHWARSYIERIVSSGAVSGYPDHTFRPEKTISRAEFVTMLVKAFNLEPASGIVFEDTSSHWAREYIASAAGNGIVSGWGENEFRPEEPVTREQMAIMIYKAAKLLPVKSDSPAFTDRSDISSWAGEAVSAVSVNGLMQGYPDGSFRPRQTADRAQAVTVVAKALSALAGELK